MLSTPAGMPCFFRAPIWASRIRIDELRSGPQGSETAHRAHRGRSRPARGRQCLNRAMSSASIGRLRQRLPRESEALSTARNRSRGNVSRGCGGSCPAAVPGGKFRPEQPFWPPATSSDMQDRKAAGSSRPARYGPRPCQDAETASRQDGRTRPASRVIHPSQEGCLAIYPAASTVRDGEEPGSACQRTWSCHKVSSLHPTPSPVRAGSGDSGFIAAKRHLRREEDRSQWRMSQYDAQGQASGDETIAEHFPLTHMM